MIGLVSFLLVVALSMLVIRTGTVALQMTGLAPDVARFQSISAFSGAGFTTAESDLVVNHPARRRIIETLIELGGAGVITGIASLVLTFATEGSADPARLLGFVAGLLGLALLAHSRHFERLLTPLIRRALRRFGDLEVRDYVGLLQLHGDYAVSELEVNPRDWLRTRRIGDLDLPAEGVTVLGVWKADGTYIGLPTEDEPLAPGDRVVAYGRGETMRELASRAAGDRKAHENAVRRAKRERGELSPA